MPPTPPRPASATAGHLELLLGARSETILRRVSLLVFLGTLVTALISPQSLWPISVSNASNYITMFVGASAWFMAHRGWARTAAIWLTACLLLVQVANATVITGVRTPGLLIALPVTITIAAWLGGLRAALLIAALGILSTLVLLLAEQTGILAPAIVRPPLTYGAVLIIGIAVTAAVQYGSLHAYQNQFFQMRQAQARGAALFHNNPVPISTLDDNSRFVDVNEAWLCTFGLMRNAVLGHTSAELGLWCDPQARQDFVVQMKSHATVIAHPAWMNIQGKPTLFHIHAARIMVDDKRHFAITMLDQSDRLAAEQTQRTVQEQLESRVAQRTAELRKSIAQLESTQDALVQSEKLASLGALVAGVAHELNTPLGNDLTLATTMQQHIASMQEKIAHNQLRKSDLTDFLTTQNEMADIMVRNTERSAALISSFKQVAVDRTSERHRSFPLRELVQDTQRALQPSLRHRSLHFVVDEVQDISCDGYPGAVGQILTNLIQNAAIHAFTDNSPGEIHIRAHTTPDRRVVLEVEDNGCGMDAQTVRKVFDPFFTTRLGQGGSGLGLSIAYNMATATLQGTLTVQSTPQKGSCFRLEYPQHLLEQAPNAPRA